MAAPWVLFLQRSMIMKAKEINRYFVLYGLVSMLLEYYYYIDKKHMNKLYFFSLFSSHKSDKNKKYGQVIGQILFDCLMLQDLFK